MYRIRFHGRGGQGIKTASRILGTACFLSGLEVQDAPRYGAERRGAPIFAYVRAGREPIQERGIIRRPDLVVVADATLVPIAAAGVLAGVDAHSVLLINSPEPAASWRDRLNLAGPIISFPATAEDEDPGIRPFAGTACVGAAARLLGIVDAQTLQAAIEAELGGLGAHGIAENLSRALAAFALMADRTGCVEARADISAEIYQPPCWVELPREDARVSAPVIHATATSEAVPTGLWRTLCPVIDYQRCNRCWWVCSSLCPDGAISVARGRPWIDYKHCKGCLVCVAQCPPHAIGIQRQQGVERAPA